MYRALSWFIDCPRDSSIDRNSDNAWAAENGSSNGKTLDGLVYGV